ncbi:hypothetical protein EJ06DRAFT_33109 [Trichodelitschia bisporula]|uniref:Uncharacterized protein n=1 Tax=Trichodelitschia bisporula TaxID=703511 RepID=A0A6G1HUQ6_9PEZI|nr:hypothetical protein EJ06DRAFT_33109 [Trichodelitschia bisporula]
MAMRLRWCRDAPACLAAGGARTTSTSRLRTLWYFGGGVRIPFNPFHSLQSEGKVSKYSKCRTVECQHRRKLPAKSGGSMLFRDIGPCLLRNCRRNPVLFNPYHSAVIMYGGRYWPSAL